MSPALSIIYSEVDVATKQHPDSSFFHSHKPLLTPFLDPCPACLRISSLQRYPTITRTTMNLPAETSQPIWSQSFASAGHRHSRSRRSGCIINSFILYHIYPPNIYACCTMLCIYIYYIFLAYIILLYICLCILSLYIYYIYILYIYILYKY